MKISKFPLFSLILLGVAIIYAFIFCKFDGAKILFDGRSKTFIQNTLTVFLTDIEKAKEYKVPEMSDETLVQMHDFFKSTFGRCELKKLSMLKGFNINSSRILKTYTATMNCEKRDELSFTVTVREKEGKVNYFLLKGNF